MHYYIDGYNFLFRRPYGEGSLSSQREELVTAIEALASALSLDITLVFDGKYQPECQPKSHFGALEILFSGPGETADELILAEVAASENPRLEVVVTSDKGLAYRAKQLKAKTVSVEEFRKNEMKRAPKKKLVAKPSPKSSPPLKKKVEVDSSYLALFEARLKEEEKLKPIPRKEPSSLVRWLAAFEHPREDDDSFH